MLKATDSSNVTLLERVVIDANQGAKGSVVPCDPNRPVSAICCSVKQGAVGIFFGGPSGGRRVPDFYFGQSNRPVTVPVPFTVATFSVEAMGAAGQLCQASVFFIGPRD